MVSQGSASRSHLLIIAGAVLAALVLGWRAVGAQAVPLELRGTVVSEETGRPLAGVSVSIGPSSAPAVSDAEGSYVMRERQRTLDALTGVQAFLPGYLPEERFETLACHWTVVPRGERDPVCVVRLNFIMRPVPPVDHGGAACDMSGRVVFEETLAPAQVMLTVDGTKIGTLSDVDGRYLLLAVPPGLQRVTASTAGLVTERRSVVVSCGTGDEPLSVSFMMRPRPISDSE
jgi:hypothetical protein